MSNNIEDVYKKAGAFYEKYDDQELYEFILDLAAKLEEADMMKHQFHYLLMHARTTVAYPVRTKHFQEALERADRFLKKIDAAK